MDNIAEKARKLAEVGHEGQFRKWSNPPQKYIVHPIRVAEKVATLSSTNEADIAAAYAHDLIEDVGEYYAALILEQCGPDVLALVRELTFPTESAIWHNRPRAEKNVIRFQQMRNMSEKAKKIKMVDRWDNLNDMKDAPHRLIQKTADESYILLEICGGADAAMAAELKKIIDLKAKDK